MWLCSGDKLKIMGKEMEGLSRSTTFIAGSNIVNGKCATFRQLTSQKLMSREVKRPRTYKIQVSAQYPEACHYALSVRDNRMLRSRV